ncbi:uncharacterized protein [Chelonus insularis]|uniref:uncharacterized protein n=1 Tax=Chelonus insularis TaxID=460826 RepID=UPI00158BCB23|nr:uncharacterized protein LOC118068736 [Chelonus insularis]
MNMYDICHPSYYAIEQLGCKDKLKITTAFHVYIELCEQRKFYNVVYKYEPELDLIYFIAKVTQHGEDEIYVPWSSKNDMKLRELQKIQEKLNNKSLMIVIKSGETISLLYRVSQGLMKPPTPQMSIEKKQANIKRMKLARKINKNSRNLYELAKSQSDAEKSK